MWRDAVHVAIPILGWFLGFYLTHKYAIKRLEAL